MPAPTQPADDRRHLGLDGATALPADESERAQHVARSRRGHRSATWSGARVAMATAPTRALGEVRC